MMTKPGKGFFLGYDPDHDGDYEGTKCDQVIANLAPHQQPEHNAQ